MSCKYILSCLFQSVCNSTSFVKFFLNKGKIKDIPLDETVHLAYLPGMKCKCSFLSFVFCDILIHCLTLLIHLNNFPC